MSKLVSPLNFKAWIEENRHLLKPPVGNKCVWKDGDFIVMVVGGPNSRKDYHYNETPEFFYQIEGDIILKIIDKGTPKDADSDAESKDERKKEDEGWKKGGITPRNLSPKPKPKPQQ